MFPLAVEGAGVDAQDSCRVLAGGCRGQDAADVLGLDRFEGDRSSDLDRRMRIAPLPGPDIRHSLGEIGNPNLWARREDRRTLDGVPQFADVPRPGIEGESVPGSLIESLERSPDLPCEEDQQLLGQRDDVGSLTEWWEREFNDVETTETAASMSRFVAAIRRMSADRVMLSPTRS